ncbi:MAG: hypothetical protein DMD84_06475 [Candidatus Rokuibacteriota bacterium]|jgi:hypothetical protein|nr:MAG: hypothetical protein DME13_19595 [Candidatus Rokubacteria bacterium]PYO53347.1 MAG: hypothetical protein DMD84_06475 [Candidatus Rokubacteria bacterium]
MLIRVVPIIVVAASLLFPLTSPAAEDTPAAGVADAVTVRGIVDAIDRTLGTVALLRRERGLLVLEVRDPAELDLVGVGDPVIAQYYQAVTIEVPESGYPASSKLVRITYARALAVTLDTQ